jgi:hypothetical protein
LTYAAYVALASAALPPALAADAKDPSAQINELVKSAHEQIGTIRESLNRVEGDLGAAMPGARSGGGAGGAFAGRSYSELKEQVGSLAEIGNQITQFASRCIDEAKAVAGKFRSQTSRLRSNVSQLERVDSSMAQMTLSRMRSDLDAAEKQLQSVAGIAGSCSS